MIKGSLHINKGIYHVSFYIKDKNGVRKQKCLSTGIKATKGNKRKAEQRMQEILAKWDGVTYSNSKILLSDYVREWIERDKGRISRTTYDGYIHMFEKHIEPYFKVLKLTVQDVKPMHLEKYFSVKVEEGLSPNTVIKHGAIIRTALQDALKNGFIKNNPAELADKPKREKPKHDFYTADELTRLWSVMQGTPIELPVYFSVFFGLRRSEAIGVKWSAIDFENKTLTICNKVTRNRIDGKMVNVESNVLKSETSNRVFSLNDRHCEYLKSIFEKQTKYVRITKDYKDFVCVNEIGELIQPDYVTAKFAKLLKANGLRHIRFHDLRHSCLSILANNSNFTMKQVQDYAGHANYIITADTYSHTDISAKRAELEAITNALMPT